MSGRGLDDRSMDGFSIRGWLLAPTGGAPTRGFIVGHGYGGVDEPRFALPDRDAAYLIPCFRGLGRSPRPPIPDNPAWHLLQDIHLNNLYISGDCMEDLWFGVSAFIALHSQIAGRLDYLGSRFDRGIRALGLPGEPRLSRGRLNVPSFSHQPLRLRLSTLGAEGVKKPQIRQKATEFVHQKYQDTIAFGPSFRLFFTNSQRPRFSQAFAGTQGHVAQRLAYSDAAVAALNQMHWDKGIWRALYAWEERAYRGYCWRRMALVHVCATLEGQAITGLHLSGSPSAPSRRRSRVGPLAANLTGHVLHLSVMHRNATVAGR